jgi:DNA-binding transcriptional LysR family regulator
LETWTFDTADGPLRVKTENCFRSDNGEAVRDACANGLGITLSSTWCCYQQLQRGELVEVLKDYPLVSNTAIWAVYPSSRLLAPKVRVFIDYFTDCFGDSPYWEHHLEPRLDL